MSPERKDPAPRKRQRDRPIHVLVVDDSAVMRQCMLTLLDQSPDMKATVAADPLIAMRKMDRHRPDVILLDLEMPRMNGMSFLRQIMREDPIPVVVCSGHAARGTATALRALEEGAVEVLAKPQFGVRQFIHESAVVLFDTIRAAAEARPRRTIAARPRLTADAVLSPRPPVLPAADSEKVVAIGASTGGTVALRRVLQVLPAEVPGLVIVQHMPAIFTGAFAERLNEFSQLEVHEAANGDRVTKGRALIAPGNRHMILMRRGEGYVVQLRDGPLVSRHRPSVDVLFRSVAQAAGRNAVGVILTGMGDDGAQGLLEMKRAQATTVAQDEASCVVYGMPREAVAAGGVDTVVPLAKISAVIMRRLQGPKRSRPVRKKKTVGG